MVFSKDLLLLQSVIRTPASTDVDILVRQASRSTMRETLKEIDKRGFANVFVHLSTDDTYHLLRAVSSATNHAAPPSLPACRTRLIHLVRSAVSFCGWKLRSPEFWTESPVSCSFCGSKTEFIRRFLMPNVLTLSQKFNRPRILVMKNIRKNNGLLVQS